MERLGRTPKFVSVIIPTYNVRGTIDEQLAALAAQDYDGPFEVVVSDNGSTDGTVEYLANREYPERLNVRVVDGSRVRGASSARNVGVESAKGDFLAFCDGDDRVCEGWVAALALTAETADAVSGPVETKLLNTVRLAETTPVRPPEEPHVFPGFLPFFLAGNCGIWRDAWDSVGGYDPTYTTGCEELDLAWRLQLAGNTIGHSPGAMVSYRMREDLKSVWTQRRVYAESYVRIINEYKPYGLTKWQPLPFVLHVPVMISLLIIRNPLLPRVLTRFPRGEWVMHAATVAGRITGAVKYRTLFA